MRSHFGSERARSGGRSLTLAMLGAAALVCVTGCTAAAGAGVAAVAIGAAIATSECYGYVDVLVIDGATGGRACDADVSAASDDDVVPFTSCFYAPLTEGRWRLDVTKPGYQAVRSEIVVDPQENCERVVHYVSVRLDSLSAPPPAPLAEPATDRDTARPAATGAAVPAPTPQTVAPATVPPPSSTAPAAVPSSSAAPSSSAVPSAPPSSAPASPPPASPPPASPPPASPPPASPPPASPSAPPQGFPAP